MQFPTATFIRSLGLRPDKKRGQNFLIDRQAAERTVRAAALSPEDSVIEIGPGLGSLTFFLHAMNIPSRCYEIDASLFAALSASLPPASSVRLYHQDILKVPLAEISDPCVLIGSIPYALTTPILMKFFKECRRISRAVFIVQQEVADRVCATPGTRACGILSVYSAAYAPAERIFTIPPQSFHPVPAVASAAIILRPDSSRQWHDAREAFFRTVLRSAFSHRRKTLRNALHDFFRRHHISPGHAHRACAASGLDLSRRAETLNIGEWYCLADILRACTSRDTPLSDRTTA